MTGCYRSTALKQASSHCPRALDHFEADSPYDRSIFHVGTTAHHVLQAIGERTNAKGEILSESAMEKVALAVCEKLIAEGRKFEGRPEPPLPADAVWEGRDLALDFVVPRPFYPGGRYEYGLAVDADWQPCEYGPKARARGILDYFKVYVAGGEEEEGATVAVHRDYKSDWRANADRLQSTQLRLQTLLVHAHHGAEVDVIRRELVNIRTGMFYSEELWLSDAETRRKLSDWQKDLSATMSAYDSMRVMGVRPAAPGLGCYNCPYLSICDDGKGFLTDRQSAETKEGRARAYVVASALQTSLRALVTLDAEEQPVEVEGGRVGYLPKEVRSIVDGGCQRLLEEWEMRQGEGRFVELLEALGLGVKHFEDAFKRMGLIGRGKAKERRELMEELTKTNVQPQFCWEKDEGGLNG